MLYNAQLYLEHIINNTNSKGKPYSQGVVRRIRSIIGKLKRFEIEQDKILLVSNVNVEFAEKYKRFCNLSPNTFTTNLKAVKTICNFAARRGIETSSQLQYVSAKGEQTDSIFLDFKELDQIRTSVMPTDYLTNAQRWLLLGAELGQRSGDLLKLNANNISTIKGVECITLTQGKTDTQVIIPLSPNAKAVLKDGFPRKISQQRLNDYIKLVGKHSGICKKIWGYRISQSTKRKERVYAEKWQFISTHVLRRSWCTNNFGLMPTGYLRMISGHHSEQMLLLYIKKKPTDYVDQINEYFTQIHSTRNVL